MRLLAALSLALLAAPPAHADRDRRPAPPAVVLTAAPVYPLGPHQAELAGHLERAAAIATDVAEQAREELAEPAEAAVRRLERLRGYLGLRPLGEEVQLVPTDRRDDDPRAAEAALSEGLVVVSLHAVLRELLLADQALGQAQAHARRHLADELGTARADLASMRATLGGLRLPVGPPQGPLPPAFGAPPDVVPAPARPPPPPPPPVPMADPALQALLRAIDAQPFPQDKLRVLETGGEGQHFLVSQVQQLLARLPFSRDRMTAARLLAPRIVDRENNFRLYESFAFPAEKEQLSKILADAQRRP